MVIGADLRQLHRLLCIEYENMTVNHRYNVHMLCSDAVFELTILALCPFIWMRADAAEYCVYII